MTKKLHTFMLDTVTARNLKRLARTRGSNMTEVVRQLINRSAKSAAAAKQVSA